MTERRADWIIGPKMKQAEPDAAKVPLPQPAAPPGDGCRSNCECRRHVYPSLTRMAHKPTTGSKKGKQVSEVEPSDISSDLALASPKISRLSKEVAVDCFSALL